MLSNPNKGWGAIDYPLFLDLGTVRKGYLVYIIVLQRTAYIRWKMSIFRKHLLVSLLGIRVT